MKWTEHRASGDGPSVEARIDRLEHGIDDVAQAVRARFHAFEYRSPVEDTLDRNCCEGGGARRQKL